MRPETPAPSRESAGHGTDAARQRWVRGLTSGTAVLLVALLLAMVNYLGWKYHHRFDWTEAQLYSLSEKTENVLASLDDDVDVVVFLSPVHEMYEPTMELLARYEDASPHVSVRQLDPERNLLEARRLAEEYELTAAAVVFDGGDERQVVAASDLAEYDFSGMQVGQGPEVSGFVGEQRFTRALLDLSAGDTPRVLFTTGHGEIPLDDRSMTGLAEAQALLREDNFELEEWSSLGADSVPEGTDLVVIAGPTSTFLPPELELFTEYLESGGRMLVLLDPVLGGADSQEIRTTGLEEWLAGYGVDAGLDVVIDPANPLPFFGAETLYANRYPAAHPVTRSVRQGDQPVLVSLARSVRRGDVPDDLEASVLVETSPQGWGETDLAEPQRDPGDLAGPVPLAVVVSEPEGDAAEPGGVDAEDLLAGDTESGAEEPGTEEPGTEEPADEAAGGGADGPDPGLRLVVFGDSTFATDQLLVANRGNSILLVDTLNWLVEREQALGIPAREPERVRLNLTGAQLRWIYLLALAFLPGLGLALGAFVYYRRRR